MTRTPSSPRYLELSSSVTFIWLFIVSEAGLVWPRRPKKSEAAFCRRVTKKWAERDRFLFGGCSSWSNFLVFDCAFPATTFCRRAAIVRRLFDSFFLIKEKWAIIKCNAFQMITRDGFIHVTIRVPGVIEELICRMVEIFSMKKLKLIKHNNW